MSAAGPLPCRVPLFKSLTPYTTEQTVVYGVFSLGPHHFYGCFGYDTAAMKGSGNVGGNGRLPDGPSPMNGTADPAPRTRPAALWPPSIPLRLDCAPLRSAISYGACL